MGSDSQLTHPPCCAKGVPKSESEARKALGDLCGTPSKTTVKNHREFLIPFFYFPTYEILCLIPRDSSQYVTRVLPLLSKI